MLENFKLSNGDVRVWNTGEVFILENYDPEDDNFFCRQLSVFDSHVFDTEFILNYSYPVKLFKALKFREQLILKNSFYKKIIIVSLLLVFLIILSLYFR